MRNAALAVSLCLLSGVAFAATPADWKQTGLGAGFLGSPDTYFAELKGSGDRRLLYVITARAKNASCRTEIHFDAKNADTAMKIGESLRVK